MRKHHPIIERPLATERFSGEQEFAESRRGNNACKRANVEKIAGGDVPNYQGHIRCDIHKCGLMDGVPSPFLIEVGHMQAPHLWRVLVPGRQNFPIIVTFHGHDLWRSRETSTGSKKYIGK